MEEENEQLGLADKIGEEAKVQPDSNFNLNVNRVNCKAQS